MIRAQDLGVIACERCQLVMRAPDEATEAVCARCDAPLHRRRPRANPLSWSLLAIAALLYIPANTLTMMETGRLSGVRDDTIFSGVVFLWRHGSWDLALLVFTASLAIPVIKLASLAMLLITSSLHVRWRPRARTTVFRVLETIGHWSMLDVFVVALLTAMIHLGRLASVAPGPAVLPFAGVVVSTMLASAAFDPRTIWDFPRAASETAR